MKSILLIVASLFAFNEDLNFTATTYSMFGHVEASFQITGGGRYVYTFEHTPNEMNNTTFNSFQNGSSDLFYEIPTNLNVDFSRPSQFYIKIDSDVYYLQDNDYGVDGVYLVSNFFENFIYSNLTDITISIPTQHTLPTQNYQSLLNSSILYTRVAFIYYAGYLEGYSDGNTDGYLEGYVDGYDPNAFDDGYDEGYADGVYAGSLGELPDLFTILGSAFASIASILSISLFPGFTLGLLLFLPLIFGIAYVLLKLLLGNG